MTVSQMIEVLKQLDGDLPIMVMAPKGLLYSVKGVYETCTHTVNGATSTVALSFIPDEWDVSNQCTTYSPVYIPQKKQPL